MFHQGTLQEGIGKAVQESKSVLCFVSDDGDESSKWENEWMQDQNIPSSIERQAIALRLQAGSQEAGFLAAFCPVTETPTVVVIYQGQLQEQLKPGINKNDFTLRLLSSINRSQASRASVPARQTTPPQSTASSTSQSASTQPVATPPTNSPPPPSSSHQPPPQETTHSSTAPSTARARRPNETSYAEEQAQRKRDAKKEHQRILQQIENDKKERREREEQRRRDAAAAAEAPAEPNSLPTTQPSTSASSSPTVSATARIQVRLTDGSTLRNTFPSAEPLSAVRRWIDAERTDDNAPYTLKQILTPQPSRALSDVEETQSLQELGLAPSAALVMVPAKGAVRAYASRIAPGASGDGAIGAANGALSRLWAFLTALLTSIVEAIRTFLGLNMDANAAQNQSGASSQQDAKTTGQTVSSASTVASGSTDAGTAQSGGSIRIRTLRDQRERDGRDVNPELYNGNQLNFEPREKDEDENNGGSGSGGGGGGGSA